MSHLLRFCVKVTLLHLDLFFVIALQKKGGATFHVDDAGGSMMCNGWDRKGRDGSGVLLHIIHIYFAMPLSVK